MVTGGTGRKRPLEPSQQAIEKDSKRKDGKSKKKRKGNKGPGSKDKGADGSTSKSSSDERAKSSLESTATAEGRIMAQVLSTFSRAEQSRFEAFRRSAFCSDAIRRYVAHCLVAQQDPTLLQDDNNNKNHPPELEHLCAPGQAEDITIVVSTLAKAYAQRLVTAARAVAEDPSQPIQPKDILKAHRERQAKGLDPGFFLQSQQQPSSSTAAWVTRSNPEFSQQRLAALYYQEQYEQAQQAKEKDNENVSKDSNEETKMDISPAKEEQKA